MKIPVWVLWEAKGDVHSVPFCTGLLLFCEIYPKQPHLIHLSHFKTVLSPCEKRKFLPPLYQNIQLGVPNTMSASWAVYRTAGTLSSVASETPI